MQDDLIYDIGLHRGLDTEFYLAKGFRVVAVEADKDLAAAARTKFAGALRDGRLQLVEAAIAERAGTVRFFRNNSNSEWGTIDPGFAERNERFGAASEVVEVPAITFADLLARHGVPYYVKVDIEGADDLCIAAIEQQEQRPRYVSFETAGPARFPATFLTLARLVRSGFRSFQLANQARHRRIRLPQPAREGCWVDHRFRSGSSGPFGAELGAPWLPLDALLREYLPLLRAEDRWSINGRGRPWLVRLRQRGERLRLVPPLGWFDIHARRDDTEG
jgi:FkbM family methyltransferase